MSALPGCADTWSPDGGGVFVVTGGVDSKVHIYCGDSRELDGSRVPTLTPSIALTGHMDWVRSVDVSAPGMSRCGAQPPPPLPRTPKGPPCHCCGMSTWRRVVYCVRTSIGSVRSSGASYQSVDVIRVDGVVVSARARRTCSSRRRRKTAKRGCGASVH